MDTTPSSATPSVAASVVGLDVSKGTLDVCLLAGNKRYEKQFTNDTAGHRPMLRWSCSLAKEVPCHFCLDLPLLPGSDRAVLAERSFVSGRERAESQRHQPGSHQVLCSLSEPGQ
jgi:hypothetical protein